ncbi:MAG: hypothetical protein U0694_09700 [Anaerolineae bacterium]
MNPIPTQNPPIPRLLYFVTLIEVLVLFTAGGGLFFAPEFTNTLWPWALTPFNTRFLGAVYLASMSAVVLMVLKNRWSPTRPVLRVIFSFTLIVLIVSILYNASFDFQRWGTWLWYALYIVLPLNSAYHLWLLRHMPTTHLSPTPRMWSTITRVLGLILILYGVGLLLLPAVFSRFFPWLLDDFHSQLYSAVFVGGGVGLLTVSSSTDGWEFMAAGVPLCVLGVLAIAGLLLVDAAVQRMVWTEIGVWLWLGAFALMAVMGVSIMVTGSRLLKETGS